MNMKEKAHLEKVFQDCVKLERQNKLTEYGAGQGDLCISLLKKNKQPVEVKKVIRIKCNDCNKSYSIHNEESCVFCNSKNLEFLKN